MLAGMLALAAVLAAGCQRRQATPIPTPTTRVGVVDLQAVTRAHPRWSELDAVLRHLSDVQAQLAQAPPVPTVPEPDVQRALDAEAERLRGELEKELEFLKQDAQRRIEAFADELRTTQAAKLEETRRDLEAAGAQELAAKRDELRAQLRVAEGQIRDEYRYPLLNLRLRAEVAGLTSESEAQELQQQLQALTREREERIGAKVDEIQQTFMAYQTAKEAELNDRFKAAQAALQAEGQRQLTAREQQIQAELKRSAAEVEQTFRARLERRRKELLEAAQGPGRQGTPGESLSARSARLRAELTALQEQRLRLEDAILAEVKIEVATIAQERRLDAVLTRFIANVSGTDITADVVQKLKR